MNAVINSPALPIWTGDETLRCVARIEETHDCATFELAAGYPVQYVYHPGQFVTIGVEIDGKKHYRAYSISSSPSRPATFAITVKRVDGGLVSNHLLDRFRQGDSVEVGAPMGEFHLNTATTPQEVVLLSAGSGITPMMSMARWLLDRGSDSVIRFIHSAHSEKDVIFRGELLAMKARHPNFLLDLFLSQPEGGIDCHAGRLTAERLDALLHDVSDARIFLCGQDGYMDMVEAWRMTRGISDEFFHKESFTPVAAAPVSEDAEVFRLSVPSFGKSADIRAGQTLLDIMEPEDIPIVAACRSGLCGSCKCKVVEGETDSTSKETLTEEEVAQGYVLACCTSAKSDVVIDLF